MINKAKFVLLFLLFTFHFLLAQAQLKKWQTGVIVDENIFDTASFPESHSATIAETPKGLIASWFGGTKERNPDVCIWTSRLVNGKWTLPQNVADGIVNDTLRYPTWNPVLYQIPGGKLLLFYKIGPSPSTWKGWYKTSADNGLSWSKAIALPEGILGPIKNKPVLLKNGVLISPSSTEGSGGQIHFELSKDFGETWEKVGPINDGKDPNAIQPAILQYSNGRLQALCRSKQRAIEQTWSNDYGKTWTALTKSALPNNSSGLDAVTLKDGRQLLVYNHVLPDDSMKNGKGPRTPLNVAISKDGKNWFAAAILEDSPISQYSYPAVIQSKDGMVHIVYTWRRKKIKYVKLNPAKLKLIEIKNGEWPAMAGYKAPAAGEITSD